MKKIILTVISIFVLVISNAQVKTKANHNTTRSNQTSGIMVKEVADPVETGEPAPVMVAFGCDNGVFTTVSVDGEGLSIDTYDWIPCFGTTWIVTNFRTDSSDNNDSNDINEEQKKLYERVKKLTKKDFAQSKKRKIKFEKGQDDEVILKWIEILSINNDNSNNNATKRKKCNKNFNRKGERVKRTKF